LGRGAVEPATSPTTTAYPFLQQPPSTKETGQQCPGISNWTRAVEGDEDGALSLLVLGTPSAFPPLTDCHLWLFLFRAPTHIGRISFAWDVHCRIGHVVKGCRPSLPLKEPTAAAGLARALLPRGTPDLGGLGAEPGRWAVLVASRILARRLTFHDLRFFLGRGLLGRNRGKR